MNLQVPIDGSIRLGKGRERWTWASDPAEIRELRCGNGKGLWLERNE